MHCVLLGICRQLLRLWLLSIHHDQVWYIGNKLSEVDDRLCNIKPPSEIKRTPRSLASTRAYWKGIASRIIKSNYYCIIIVAHELRAWLFHYSPAVLYQILPEIYYQHHLLLVEGTFLLLQDSVYESDIKKSSRLLQHYVFMFASLYGIHFLY